MKNKSADKYYYANLDRVREKNREYRRKQRLLVLQTYCGLVPFCACCGEKEMKFLSIDHINGGGKKHKIEHRNNLYNWIIKNNFPKNLQVLCHNCNMAKGLYGKCPHKI